MPNFSRPELRLSTDFHIVRPPMAQLSPLQKFIPHFIKNSLEATTAFTNARFCIQGTVQLAIPAPYRIILTIVGTEMVGDGRYLKSFQFLQKSTALSGTNSDQSTCIPFEIELSALQCPDAFSGDFGSISYEINANIEQPNCPRSVCTTSVPLVYRPNAKQLVSFGEDWTVNKWPITVSSSGSRMLLVHTLEDSQFLISSFRPVVTFSQECSPDIGVFEIEQVQYTLVEKVKYKKKNNLGIEYTAKNSTEIIRAAVYDTPTWDEPCLLDLYDLTDAKQIHQPTSGKLLSVSHYLRISLRFTDIDDYAIFKMPIQVVVTQ
ncbi:hypothetical protein HDV01_004634 [Terramyces sp. JEL0728]|nr:hypothetical protein HDV01_004634 [Terramyces sp. JEL0728]